MSELPHELIREFMVAVVEDRPKAELLLAEHPNLLNARWMHNETALHYLAIEDLGDAVNFLLAHGADVNTVNEFGDSPLVDVANLGNNEIAELLVAAGADPNGPKTALQGCPLHHAARKGNVALVLLLLDAGANPAYVTGYRETLSDALAEAPSDDGHRLRSLLAERGLVAPDGHEKPEKGSEDLLH
jgi:ankyrin repeat protein